MDVQEIADREQIRQVLYRYCRGADRRDESLLRSVYHPGARDRHGSFDGPAEEFAAYVAGREGYRAVQHLIGNILIDIDGDLASVESVFTANLVSDTDTGPARTTLGGRYCDLFERLGGEWRISDRIVVLDWTERQDKVTESDLASAFPPGQRGAADPSYQLAETLHGRR